MSILAIDPGPTASAYVLIGAGDRHPISVGKVGNGELLADLPALGLSARDGCAIEMIASYGMAVGADVFETCIWIGRFIERSPRDLRRIYRRDIKLHHCGNARAKDPNVTQALVDRFAPGIPNKGKGTKAAPGFFYGFHSDIWAAFALAVYVADTGAGRGAAA